jgi:hypothetical protein
MPTDMRSWIRSPLPLRETPARTVLPGLAARTLEMMYRLIVLAGLLAAVPALAKSERLEGMLAEFRRPWWRRCTEVVVLAVALPGSVVADERSFYIGMDYSECQSVIDQYNSSIQEIDHLIRRYVQCISNSRERDDCSLEFRRLKRNQEDFESSVLQFQSECES